MQAVTKRNDFNWDYNLGILLWILNTLAFRLMFHNSVIPKLRLALLSPADKVFAPLLLPVPASCDAISIASTLLLFINFTTWPAYRTILKKFYTITTTT